MLLHGQPRTGATWHRVAPALVELGFRVVVPDLRGYGASRGPDPAADHAPASKRAMGRDLVAVMDALGVGRFSIAGHDRGSYVAYRMAMQRWPPVRVSSVERRRYRGWMEYYPSTPNVGAGDSVGSVRGPNIDDVRRPRRYWAMLGAMLAVFGLIPLASDLLPPLAMFLIVPLLLMAIGITAARKLPRAVRSLKLIGIMWLPYIGGVLLIAVLAGLGAALYSARGGWEIPVVTAAMLFLVSVIGGPALDAFWARHAEQPSATTSQNVQE